MNMINVYLLTKLPEELIQIRQYPQLNFHSDQYL